MKSFNNNLGSNTKNQAQNPYDISKTINTRQQNNSPNRNKMNTSITTKFLPNQKSPIESQEIIQNKSGANSYHRQNSMK